MKRNVIQLTVLVMMMLALAVSSCKDDTTLDGGTDGGSGGGAGGGGGGTVDADYLPRSAGNTWNYSDDATVDMDVDNGDYWSVTNFGPISGVSLSIVEGLSVESISVKKDEGDYWMKAQLTVIELPGIIDGTAEPIEYIILKDDASTGDTWVGELVYSYSYANPIPGLPPIVIPSVTVPYTFTIMEKDMSVTIGNDTYTNVIKVNQSFNNLIGGLVSTDIYYADGVGVIRYGANDGVTTPVDLVTYDVE